MAGLAGKDISRVTNAGCHDWSVKHTASSLRAPVLRAARKVEQRNGQRGGF
jgi:hypothetical protein